MTDAGPFYDPETHELDVSQVFQEAIPIAGLILLFGLLAVVPFYLGALALDDTVFGLALALLGQFVLAVGSAIVLLYVVARGVQLAEA